MVKKTIRFALKSQEHNPKIKEGKLIGIAIQTWRNWVWSSCGYLMLPNDQEAIQNLEKRNTSQEYFFHLDTKIRVEDFKEDVISDEGKKLGVIGKKKIYVEDPNWGQKIKLIYPCTIHYFVPKKVVRNENNLLQVEIEPMEFYVDGLIDELIFTGAKINQYRELITQNLGKEFKMPVPIFNEVKNQIDTKEWIGEEDKIELVERKTGDRPEKTIPELRESLTEYYRNKGIKSIKLSDEDKEFLDIVFNSGEKKTSDNYSKRYDKQKFEQVKLYLQSNGKKSLDYLELTGDLNPELNDWKNKLKKWMEQENIEEIILKSRNVVLCKKCNGEGSIQFGDEPPVDGGKEIPENLQTKINGVDIGLFFEKIGKNSISRQELGIGKSKKTEQTENNFVWTPWLISGGAIVFVSFCGFLAFFVKKGKRGINHSVKLKHK
ncbi:MAG: hypothetical protein I3270_02240 [Candidatus Moeniiplasma glomeromycotorum]|nr:hypothetical protein [Candidatus Moeniiplasma glomeromycotorum]MCE8162516.1 hypothetical protein [Candidatus Moeniiplasma glomeromycotorum]MCE8166443.1 hypothetical protein [Candidatus Moeniiplasma glomeromycotorum]MCE8166928.1 hypothetical protein [Candidatus Moeniiplasma glomeromycotorum]